MRSWRILAPCLLLPALSLLALPASAQFVLMEPGFEVTDLGSGAGPKGAACSPGGVWGNYIYIGESNGNAIERIDFADNMSVFASGSPDIDFPVGMVFGPGPAADFGTYLYVASYGSGRITRLDPSGTPSLFINYASVSDLTFDPSGVYGTDMFAIEYFGGISTVDNLGTVTPFSAAVSSSYMRFGPGGAWGTGLYATSNGSPGVGIIQVASDGTPTLFAGGFVTPEQFDWAFGGVWGGDMFATDYSTGDIFRIQSDGTATVWANIAPERPAGMVFCNDCLYITSHAGGCWRVCASPVPVEPSTWGTIKKTYADGEE